MFLIDPKGIAIERVTATTMKASGRFGKVSIVSGSNSRADLSGEILRAVGKLFVLVVAGAIALFGADAVELLREVGNNYRNLESFHFEIDDEGESRGEWQRNWSKSTQLFAFEKPNRVRAEVRRPGHWSVLVSDGRQAWVHRPGANEYERWRAPADPFTKALEPTRASTALDALRSKLHRELVLITQDLEQAELIREEAIEIGGRSITCWVIGAEYQYASDSPTKEEHRVYWVDKARKIVLRERHWTRVVVDPVNRDELESDHTVTYLVAKINEPLPEELFTFAPPADAVERTRIAPRPRRFVQTAKPVLVPLGAPAPDFTLSDLSGRAVSLSDYRGKPVLLSFWATWCGHCHAHLAHLRQLYEETRPQGLVVLGVSADRELHAAIDYLRERDYRWTNVWDKERTVWRRYGIWGIPTAFLIDSKGIVIERMAGGLDKAREALRSLGIEWRGGQ